MDSQNFVAEMTNSPLFTPDMLNRVTPNGIPQYSDEVINDEYTDDDGEDDNRTAQTDQSLTSGQPPMKRNRRRPRGKKK